MSFSRAQVAYLQLRRRLTAYVSADVLPDITIEPPKDAADELAFLRLVAWSYTVLHETAKLSLGVLRHLPPLRERSGALLPHVRALRTWTSHNLALESKTDVATIRSAIAWFRANCGTGTPSSAANWAQCFDVLLNDISTLLEQAVKACDAFEDPVDGKGLKEEFERRLERSWEGFQFDSFVEAACNLLGYSGLDVVPFRNKHLQAWRDIVALSEPDAIDKNLTKRVEADVLLYMGDAAPLTGTEFQALLSLSTGQEIRACLSVFRGNSMTDRKVLIDHIYNVTRGEAGSAGPADDG
ncbi:hypothetical protein IST4116A_05620 [Burkholderia cenocepacia]|uniref:hypothetical protein n=1 Tax=Burkholderia cenocepacia TaxID=95486 RepID=UPI001982ED1F|nr:hypothetical protein [Burkholderia cenocepacia]CAB5106077.1 hypothetical protein IST4112_05622 [Burkholderia cenocepacia]CAB5110700.1 hypothetical protein IST4113_05630 [Burkholderia cenocepacia]CAB5133333.1 hypothetical protein IST4134_05632 [Burkholderia cenocepacia]CAB5135632.1 hypothetical protein IST4129_05632 [Burkholderia cenocepacia]CAB5137256.1 hypothetical protein IST4116B_05615 [Burkholderia cenocepacia]